MSCWQKLFIVLVVGMSLAVLLADLVVTASADSCSLVRRANVSSRVEMYA